LANLPVITDAPAFKSDRQPLYSRTVYDLSDYGYVIPGSLNDKFDIVPITLDEEQAFFFLFPKQDIDAKRYSLFNFHAFLKYSGTVESFARSRGKSVETVSLSSTEMFGVPALRYARQILMKDLFEGAEQVITFIGGQPDLMVQDSHTYFTHRHNFYYSGMIHLPGDDSAYDDLRASLSTNIKLV
jgi:hypothetical protein